MWGWVWRSPFAYRHDKFGAWRDAWACKAEPEIVKKKRKKTRGDAKEEKGRRQTCKLSVSCVERAAGKSVLHLFLGEVVGPAVDAEREDSGLGPEQHGVSVPLVHVAVHDQNLPNGLRVVPQGDVRGDLSCHDAPLSHASQGNPTRVRENYLRNTERRHCAVRTCVPVTETNPC